MLFGSSDDDLVAKVAAGDARAFRTLFDRHAAKVLGLCARMLGHTSRGEDAAQEVWMKMVKASASYKSEGKFSAWIMTIARTTCLDELRRSGARMEVGLGEQDLGESAVVTSEWSEQLEREKNLAAVKAEIDALPDNQRVALVLWLSGESSYDDIARELDLSVGAVKSLLFRARQTLEERLRRRA